MRCRSHPLLALFLSALLAVAGVVLAAARPGLAAGGTEIMVFCTGNGLVQLVLGPDGKPTGEHRICPDLAATALAGVALDTTDQVPPAARTEPIRPAARVAVCIALSVRPVARGPPTPV